MKMFEALEQTYTRINSEAQAYQFMRYVMKKQRLRSIGVRQDKRVMILGDLLHIEVGAYYRIHRLPSGLSVIQILGTHQFKHMIDVAKNLLLSVGGGEDCVDTIEHGIFAAFTDMPIEEKCFHYLMSYEMLGGDLTKHKYFGSMIEDILEIKGELEGTYGQEVEV
jgi:hypothetical protein